MIIQEIKYRKLMSLFVVFVLLCSIVFAYVFFSLRKKNIPPVFSDRYLDSSLTIEERVDDLVAQMTLKEKIGQMALVEKNSVLDVGDVSAYGIGGILSGAGGKPDTNTPEGWQVMVGSFIDASRSSRLSIPVIYGVDANHGHGNVPGSTVFPHFIGLGATGDVELVEKVAHATADELLTTGIRWSYSPTLDTVEDIRWGRTYETFSSDPDLISKLGSAYVRGLQQDNLGTEKQVAVMATAKHFVGVGGMEWNTSSNKNFSIDQGVTPPDELQLRTVYLPPFKSTIDEGVLSVMAGLNSWGDTNLSAERYLLTDILKEELGFKGFVVSDWYGVYEISSNDFYSAIVAINAGVDMVMLPFDYKSFVQNVSWAVVLGLVPESRIDDAVSRILYAKFKLGLFDDTQKKFSLDSVGSTKHRSLAREAVAKSLVLLKNEGSILPISQGVRNIHVAGSAAHNVGKQSGAWTVEWQGIDGNWLPGATSILEGLQEAKSNNVAITYSENGVFKEQEGIADVGIAVVGENPYAEGWGDNALPRLSEEDLSAIDQLKTNSRKVVVILVTGRPLIITDELPKWDAFVVAWLPGSEGGGVGDVLFGNENFVGTLPLSWPRSIEQLPITYDEKTADGNELLFKRYDGLITKK